MPILGKQVVLYLFFFFMISQTIFSSFVRSFPLILSAVTRRDILLQNTLAILSMTPAAVQSSDASAVKNYNSTIRWGIVGLGDVCQKKSGPAFFKCHNSQLVAAMRRTPGKAKEFAETKVPKDNHCVGYESLAEFLRHPNLDAVYVSTRPGTQLEICEAVAAAGKACYVEKPVGRCAEETQAIVDTFEKAGLPLYTAYISRAYARTQAVRNMLLREGCPIGDRLTKVSYTLIGTGGARDMDEELPWRFDAEQSGGGLIMDVGCHILDRIEYLCGPLKNVKGETKNKNSPNQKVEDFVHLTATVGSTTDRPSSNDFISREGATVECTWDFASPDQPPCDRLILEGPKGFLQMTGMSPNAPIEVYDADGKLQKTLKFEMPEHTAKALIQAVTNDLLAQPKDSARPDLLSFGDNAVRTQQVIDTVLKPYYGGREIGYWSRMTN
jgi:1,5-anhydro-D-fructose reductase (1,5-anhydro-D-mannitol-forming)